MPWIYRYLRADGEEIDMGPYDSHDEALVAKKEHSSFGAMCSTPEEVPDDYRLYKGPEEYSKVVAEDVRHPYEDVVLCIERLYALRRRILKSRSIPPEFQREIRYLVALAKIDEEGLPDGEFNLDDKIGR